MEPVAVWLLLSVVEVGVKFIVDDWEGEMLRWRLLFIRNVKVGKEIAWLGFTGSEVLVSGVTFLPCLTWQSLRIWPSSWQKWHLGCGFCLHCKRVWPEQWQYRQYSGMFDHVAYIRVGLGMTDHFVIQRRSVQAVVRVHVRLCCCYWRTWGLYWYRRILCPWRTFAPGIHQVREVDQKV